MKEQPEIRAVLKVLHVLGPLRPSGMERMLVSAAPHFAEAGIESTVYGRAEGSTFVSDLEKAGYHVVLGPAPAASLRTARSFSRLVRERGIKIVHIHTEADYLRTALLARLAVGRSGRVVRTVHSNFLASGRWLASRRLQALLSAPLVSATVAPSPDVAETEKMSIGRDCQVVFNWVDDRIFRLRSERLGRAGSGTPTALILGNYAPVKAHELAIEAVRDAGWSLMHLGDEANSSDRERVLLDLLDREGRLRRRGAQEPDDALVEADVFLMPSQREGMGVALAEALTAGMPALVRDAPGLGWARSFDHVTYLSDELSDWTSALRNMELNRGDGASTLPPVDLSAARGAREYAAIYLGALTPLRWKIA